MLRLLLFFVIAVTCNWVKCEESANANSSVQPKISRQNESTALECRVNDDCSSLYPLSKIKLRCSRRICVCSGPTIKVNNRCVDVLGLPCSAIGHCEYYVDNSVCDLTDSGRCVCKNGFYEEDEWFFGFKKCSPILGRPCDSNAKCNGIINTECVSDTGQPASQQHSCRCVVGLRPNNPRDRQLFLRDAPQKWFYLREEDDVSTSCEVVIGNDCESNRCCSTYVKHSHCNTTKRVCECDNNHIFNPLNKLCEKPESSYNKPNAQRHHNIPAHMGFHKLKSFCNATTCSEEPHMHTTLGQGGKAQSILYNHCFLMYFPCAVHNSLCLPHPYHPYQGYCGCRPGFAPVGEDSCISDTGDAAELDTPSGTEMPEGVVTLPVTDSPLPTATTDSDNESTPGVAEVEQPLPNELRCGHPGTARSSEVGLSSFFDIRKTRKRGPLNRIVGGQDALQNEICWQAGVISFDASMQKYEYCGGTILNEKWILTAMHCVVENNNIGQPTPTNRIFVAVGATNFPVANQLTGSLCGSYLKVQQVIIYPTAQFVQSEEEKIFLGIADDLALLKLEQKLDFSESCVCPLCLLSKHPRAGEICIVSGYGCQNPDCQAPPPHSLAWLKVAIEDKNSSRCQHGSAYLSPDKLICIGSTVTADACSGDSGGPLACFDTITQSFYLAGATSYGFGEPPNKCASGELARYTDVPAYIEWISNVTQALIP